MSSNTMTETVDRADENGFAWPGVRLTVKQGGQRLIGKMICAPPLPSSGDCGHDSEITQDTVSSASGGR